jgi:hypothetical protein
VRALIAELLDDARLGGRGRTAVLYERAVALDADDVNTFRGGLDADGEYRAIPLSHPQRVLQALRTPHRRLILAEQTRFLVTIADAVSQPDWPSAAAMLPATPRLPRPTQSTPPLILWLNQGRQATWNYSVQIGFLTATERRCAAALLALRLYQLDHAGRLPAQLAELAGTFLPQIPTDPMARGAKPLGYARSGATAYVYSVGRNGRDDVAGGWVPGPDNYRDMNSLDYVAVLDRSLASTMPATVPATAPVTTAPGPSRP